MLIKNIIFLALVTVSTFAYGDEASAGADENDNAQHYNSATESADEQQAAQVGGRKNQCEQEWARYKESQECFARFVTAQGRIKAEAYNYCSEVKQPPPCR